VHTTNVSGFTGEIVAMLAGGIIAAWVGAGTLARIPKHHMVLVIALLLIGIAILLALETVFAGATHLVLPPIIFCVLRQHSRPALSSAVSAACSASPELS